MNQAIAKKNRVAKAIMATVAAIVVGISIFFANVVGFLNEEKAFNCFGWPGVFCMRACVRTCEIDLSQRVTSRWVWGTDVYGYIDPLEFTEISVLFVNAYLGVLIVACTFYVMVSRRFSQFPRQWTLRQFFTADYFGSVSARPCA